MPAGLHPREAEHEDAGQAHKVERDRRGLRLPLLLLYQSMINQDFQIPIAFDKSVKVKRIVKIIKKKNKGFLKKKRILNQGYSIIINNFDKNVKLLNVFDRIPRSKSKKIEVVDVEIFPKPAVIEKNGILQWKIKLKPGEEKKINVNYKVTYLKDLNIIFK